MAPEMKNARNGKSLIMDNEGSPDSKDLYRAKKVAPFILRLYEMLQHADQSIIGWNRQGSAFEIRDKFALVETILPEFFSNNNFSSFQRQLNYFGFRKWSKFKSPICTYSREVFERGNLERLHRIKRHTNNKLKSVGSGESDDEDGSQVENESKIGNETTEEEEESRHEDAQLLMKLMAKKEQSGDSTPSGSPLSDESSRTIASPGGMFPHLPEINKARQSQGPARLPSLCDLFRIGRQQQTAMERCSENDGNYFNERNSLTPSEAAKLDYSPLSDLQSSRMSGGFDRGIGSSYTDSDNVMRRARGPNFNESDNAMRPVPAFLKFLYTMVNDQSQSIVTWAEEGKAFTINNLNTLPSLLLRYFRHGKYSSFQRQLNMYGFKKWSKAPGSKRTYTHPYFRQGGQNHLWKIKRHNRAQQNRGHAA